MIKIDEVTMQNFYSIGNIPQTIKVKDNTTTLIMGDNVDYGSSESGTIRNGVGKAQPLTAKIRIANGWVTMGDIKVGDIVMTPDSKTAVVVGKYPQGKRTTYTITTADGKKTTACKEHLWELSNGEVIDTTEMASMLTRKEKVYLPMAVSYMDSYKQLSVSPYIVGMILASGYVDIIDGIERIVVPCYDEPLVQKVQREQKYKVEKNVIIIDDHDSEVLYKLFDFSNKVAIPVVDLCCYDYDTRKEILCGVFDLVVDINESELYKTNLQGIFEGSVNSSKHIRDLIWSIGGLCKRTKHIRSHVNVKTKKHSSHEYHSLIIKVLDVESFFSFDKLETDRVKYDTIHNRVVSIKKDKVEEVCCIKISGERHLYITDDFIPTHNTTVINGISYALFGETITKPRKKAAIINYFNGKGLLVTLKFSVNDKHYIIERGQKPTVMRFVEIKSDGTEVDLAQGSTSNTDAYIASTIGMSHLLCKYIMLMSTYAEPFMNEDAAKQRAIIEELLGIGELSEKAERIKEKEKFYSMELEKEQVRIKTIQESNLRVERAIAELASKSNSWNIRQQNDIKDIEEEITTLGNINIEEELNNHKHNSTILETNRTIDLLENELRKANNTLNELTKVMAHKHQKLNEVSQLGVCHACKQTLGEDESTKQQNEITIELEKYLQQYDENAKMVAAIQEELSKLTRADKIRTYYPTIERAYEHEKVLSVLVNELENKKIQTNPFDEQIATMSNTDYGIQEIDYTKVEECEKTLKHYKFLKKLLTHKDSFLRKVIINRSLPFLNARLRHYLDLLSLPHDVVFDADLTFNITHMGVDSDYSLLSRGEQNRVTYALNLSFRDLFENTRNPINVLFVDELLDFGVDTTGAIAGLQILKSIAYSGRSTYLVTHKEELAERVPNIIYVKKENGFTTYEEQNN